MGILYLLSSGILGIGCFINLFTLGGQVDRYNAIYIYGRGANNSPIVVNVLNNNNNTTSPSSEGEAKT